MENDKEILKQIGFLDAEIEIYKTLLRLGPSLVSKLAKETGHHRTHIYDLLEKLREKGLVSSLIQSGKRVFKASNPSSLLKYVEDKKEIVNAIIADLNSLSKMPVEETEVELFKGKEGMKSILQDFLENKKDYCVMGSMKKFEEVLEYSMPSFLKKIEKLKVKERIICDKKEKIIKIKTGAYRYLDSGFIFPSSFWIYEDKVAIFVWNFPYFCVLIKNKDIAETYQNYFEFFWKQAKP